MAIFKKLYAGDTVYSSGTRAFKKLTTENPTPLPITDLTGTTWRSASFDAQAGYGEFDVDVKFRNKYELDTTIFDKLSIGYDAEATTENSICLYGDDGTTKTIKSALLLKHEYTFTGGKDATNTRLIGWLLENFILEQHPEILGTWVFNDTIAELPIFDDTVEDAYNEDGRNLARFIKVRLATTVQNQTSDNLAMCNFWQTLDENGQSLGNFTNDEALVSVYLIPVPIYNYETKEYLGAKTIPGNYLLSNNAKNEITILYASNFTNYSGVDVSDKFYAWLKANAMKVS